MPLLQTPSALAAAQIAEAVINTRSHYVAAAGHLNSITRKILALSNEDLAAFGNELGPMEMQMLTSAHGQQGDGLNQLIAGSNAVLAESGITPTNASVDVRPLAEKLAEQRREIVLTDGVFTVVDFPPLPEPPVEVPPEEENSVEEA
jgi:hypothetical protein